MAEGDREWDRQMGERDREKVKEGMGGRGNRSFIGWGYGTRQMVGICEFTPYEPLLIMILQPLRWFVQISRLGRNTYAV